MEEQYTSFVCTSCHSEIQASPDMIGQTTECPACGAKIVIPDSRPKMTRHTMGDDDPDTLQAMKSRTIRIELGDF